LTAADVQGVTTVLLSNNAYTILDNIEGENRFGTAPVRDSYMAFCHTDLCGQMNNVAGFTHKNNYPSQTNIGRSEWGSVQNLRFWVSSVGSTTPAGSFLGATVYNIFVTGMESYCYIEQDHLSATFIYRPAIFDGPLALNASVGYKFGACPRLLNDLWLFNLRCTLA
jgi:N4-gp56 family major capsid protein